MGLNISFNKIQSHIQDKDTTNQIKKLELEDKDMANQFMRFELEYNYEIFDIDILGQYSNLDKR